MRNALGPIVAETHMRRARRSEVDLLGSAPCNALFRDAPGPIADSHQISADERVGKRNAKLAREMTVTGSRLAQWCRQPRACAVDLLRPDSQIDETFDQRCDIVVDDPVSTLASTNFCRCALALCGDTPAARANSPAGIALPSDNALTIASRAGSLNASAIRENPDCTGC